MNLTNEQLHSQQLAQRLLPFETFKQKALQSLMLGCAGFFLLGVFWIFFTVRAYTAVRASDLTKHEGYMIYSFAACFAAVMLRVWMPILILIFGEFLIAYSIVAWLCWVPNLIFAYFWVRKSGLQLG